MKSIRLLVFLWLQVVVGNSVVSGLSVLPNRARQIAVIAHRGASGYLPEHTLESKALAYMMHSDYLEQDLVLTRDNVPIVLHDIYLDEVTDVASKYPDRGRFLANSNVTKFYAIDFDLAEIKTLRATERFHVNGGVERPVYPARFPLWQSSFQLVSFEEELEFLDGLAKSFNSVAQTNAGEIDLTSVQVPGIYPEIKRPEFHSFSGKGNFSEIVLRILDKFNYTTDTRRQVLIQCFDPEELKRIKFELGWKRPLVQLLALTSSDLEGLVTTNYTYWTSDEGLAEIKKFASGIGPEKDQLITIDQEGRIRPSRLHETAKKLGLFMHPYTYRVDSLPKYVKSYSELLDLFFNKIGIDGLFTDFPDITKRFIETKVDTGNSAPLHKPFPSFIVLLAIFISIFSRTF